ncbi:MAG: DUF4097 domain-containing protein [bacterium]
MEEHTFDIKPGAKIILIGDEGNIVVSSWDKNEVQLKITKRVWERSQKRAEKLLDELEVTIDHSPNRLFIRERDIHKNRRDFWDLFDSDKWTRYQIDYELSVPEEIDLNIENDEGDVEVEGISGRLKCQVDEGNIVLNDLSSVRIDVDLDEGHLICKNIQGKHSSLFADIDEGFVRLSNSEFKELDINSDEGDLILKNLVIEYCTLSTDEGDIEATMELAAEGRCKMKTDEGDIHFVLPENVDVELRLETAEGRIRSEFPVSVRRSGDDGERVDDRLGQGLASISAFTDEGNIILAKK